MARFVSWEEGRRGCRYNRWAAAKVAVAGDEGAPRPLTPATTLQGEMTVAPAPDDIVRSHAAAAANDRPPLLVVEPLLAFLDAHGLGSGDVEIVPLGEGHSNVTYLARRGDRALVVRRPPRPPLPPPPPPPPPPAAAPERPRRAPGGAAPARPARHGRARPRSARRLRRR